MDADEDSDCSAHLRKNALRQPAYLRCVSGAPIEAAHMFAEDSTMYRQSNGKFNMKAIALDFAGDWADISNGSLLIELSR
jgi:hypothetical protein